MVHDRNSPCYLYFYFLIEVSVLVYGEIRVSVGNVLRSVPASMCGSPLIVFTMDRLQLYR